MSETTPETIRADQVEIGDLIDLENVPEPYVSAEDAENYYAYELAEVIDRVDEQMNDGSIGALVEFNSTTIVFPADYELTIIGTRED